MDIVRSIIQKELELPIIDIANPEALVDGGDILFTGTCLISVIKEKKKNYV